MKACIDKFLPNTSQANYFEGFWRIASKTNGKIEVRKQFESCVTIADSAVNLQHMLFKRNESFPLGLRFAFCHQSLAYFDELYQ